MTVFESLAALAELVDAEDDLFLRYSTGPQRDEHNGPSRDVEADVTMLGWSVTPLTPEPWWTRTTSDWIARRVTKYAELGSDTGRRPWVLRGRIVGRGPDQEPLVSEPRFVAWIDERVLEEADAHYTEVFDRGRASNEIRTE